MPATRALRMAWCVRAGDRIVDIAGGPATPAAWTAMERRIVIGTPVRLVVQRGTETSVLWVAAGTRHD